METVAINPMDAAWLYIEKREAPAHFGPLIFMSCPEGEPDFVARLVSEWRKSQQFAPPFNYRLAKGLVPKWEIVPNDELDMEYHLMHVGLPAPGGEQQLGVLVSRLHSHRLDRRRPLWQVYIIEGLEDNRFALYLKLHHSQLDGMGAARLMARCFSSDPGQRGLVPPWSVGLSARKSSPKADAKALSLANGVKQGKRLMNIAGALGTLGKHSYFTRDHALFAPYQGPKSVLNSRIRGHRRYATQRFELDELKAVAGAAEAKVNDVFLAITGAALRRYLSEISALPRHSLVGQVPVSIRPAGDGSVGNALSFVYATLGTDLEDPIERLHAVRASTESAKALQSQLSADAIEAYTAIVLAPYITETILNLGGHLRPAANLVISNVQGPRERLYFNGARVEHIYGPSVLFHGQALNITMASYADEVNIGYTACRDTLPSMQKIAVYTREAFDELAALVGAN
ncbi:wax ester/triacylglycerol synthase family O-acyltransferase [Spongiibacter sp. KMU-166]|uniref:diacylglycerol O-acyltransferase n=1 Tax=Spongiibacter thalassae TaxID=2721624 RepID=A0ABX1GA76_9GAMM|nr:wax ester/triacylglycerol synthase family O-acyltransferase [Spongiibacter thalassae]NKI16064.1 wax ester/triacylglycerol synthase family O-acyltransferase [Spongiibacter thalassae]